jgi:hypothetical protein
LTSLSEMPTIDAKLVQEFRELMGRAFAEMRTPIPDAGLHQRPGRLQASLVGDGVPRSGPPFEMGSGANPHTGKAESGGSEAGLTHDEATN